MAEKALKKVEDHLNCSICLDTYIDPKLLQCFHVYCKECLVKLVIRDQEKQLSLSCPTCRQAAPVPANGVSGLQSAFHISHLLEIVKEHKEGTVGAVETKDVPVGGVLPQQQTSNCTEHVEEELKLYCGSCSMVVCYKCVIRGSQHHSHEYQLLDEAFQVYKDEMSPSLEPLGKQLAMIEQSLTRLESCSAEVSAQEGRVEADIESAVTELHNVLEARRVELLGQLHEVSQDKLKSLAAQKDQLETTQAQLHSCKGFVRDSIETDKRSVVLKMKHAIVHRVKELTTKFPSTLLKPCVDPAMVFATRGDTAGVLRQHGGLSTAAGVANPSKCRATGSGIEEAVLGVQSTAVVQVVNQKGRPCSVPDASLECELESVLSGAMVRGRVEGVGGGQYKINYFPVTKGRNSLHIRVDGKGICGSPFTVVVRSPWKQLRLPFLQYDCTGNPWGVAFNRAGDVIVSFSHRHLMTVYTPAGAVVHSIGTLGSGSGPFKSVRGVCVDREDNILIACSGSIQRITSFGRFLASSRMEASFCPAGIAVNPLNHKIYVAEYDHHIIRILNSDLSISGVIGRQGHSPGEFYRPSGITCDSTGNVYVADSRNNRVQVLTADGTFLRMFGSYGVGEGELVWPVGVAVDSCGTVFVSSQDSHSISVFDSEGQFLTSFGQLGDGPGEFVSPTGLAVDPYGVLYVCDSENSRVQIF